MDSTIRDNVVFFREQDDSRVWDALEKVQLHLLDRYGVKTAFCLNGILKDARREEIQKRGHHILEGDYPRIDQAIVCSSYEIANRSSRVLRQVFSEITRQGKTEIVIQDIWRADNTLVEGILLEGLQKGHSFDLSAGISALRNSKSKKSMQCPSLFHRYKLGHCL